MLINCTTSTTQRGQSWESDKKNFEKQSTKTAKKSENQGDSNKTKASTGLILLQTARDMKYMNR